jgi:rare lipoprotein A (peptidoglycan hydrolase)
MVIRTNSSNTSIKAQVGLCILAGAATGALVAIIMPFNTQAVHADVDLSRQAAITMPAQVVVAPPVIAGPTLVAAASLPVSVAVQSTTPVFATPAKPVPVIAKHSPLRIIRGLASWYGGVFNGRKTANGEKYDSNLLTACQPNLPFGSIVRVINRSNKRSVVVRINDRGDLVEEGRVIDLSKAAAEKLAMTGAGLAKVDIEVLSLGGAPTGK